MSFEGAPALPGHSARLVYFRAHPVSQLFPATPIELLQSETAGCMVTVDLSDGKQDEHLIVDVATLDLAISHLFGPYLGFGKVYTIHANSMLGRLARWHALKFKQTAPASLGPRSLGDLVELVNAPAVLSGVWRYNFRVEDYREILGLVPDPRFDPETGYLIDIINRYADT